MRLGLSAGPTTNELCRELGAKGAAIAVNALAQKGVEATMKPLRDAGLQACQIMAFAFNPLSLDQGAQQQQARILEKAIPLAAETGCPDIVINGGNYDPSGFKRGHRDNFGAAALDASARAIAPLCRLAEKHGARLAIEPFIQCAVNTPERFLALKEKVGSPALTVNLDVCNFFTYDDMWRPTEAVTRICSALAGHYTLVHCKDLTVSEGVHIHIDETPLGTGVADWATALRFIARDLPKDGWFIYEHIKAPDDARAGVKLLNELLAGIGAQFER